MKQLKQFITIILGLCLSLYSYTSMAKLSDDCLYRVTKVASHDTLTVRLGPGVQYKQVGSIPSNGSHIKIVGYEIQIGKFFWVPIEYNGISGWVNSYYLKKDCPIVEEPGCLFQVVNVRSNDSLSVRLGPGIDYKKIYQLRPNATGIEVTGGAEKVGRSYWVPIKYNYIQGWVNSRYIQEQDCL
jgi:uncharacterized protein YraI